MSKKFFLMLALFAASIFLAALFLKPIMDFLGYWNVFNPAVSIAKIVVPKVDIANGFPAKRYKIPPMIDIPKKQQDVDISFDFKVNAFHESQTLLQTSSDNDGIRIALGGEGIYVTMGTDISKPLFRWINFPPRFDALIPGKWYAVRIHAWNNHRAIVWFGNTRVANIISNKVNFNLDSTILNFNINDITVGNSFDKANPFDGEIKNFSLKYQKIDANRVYINGIYQKIILVFSALLLLLLLIRWQQPMLSKNQKIEWFSLSILVSFSAMMTYHFITSIYLGDWTNTFIFPGKLPHYLEFGDWHDMFRGANDLFFSHQSCIVPPYFPFSYLAFFPFLFLPNLGLPIVLVIFSFFVVFFVAYYFRTDCYSNSQAAYIANIKNIFIISLLSYPFWLEVTH